MEKNASRTLMASDTNRNSFANNGGITPAEMNFIEKEMESYVEQVFVQVKNDIEQMADDSLTDIQVGYIKNRYYQYLVDRYTTPLMLQYVNVGEQSMTGLVNAIAQHEKSRVNKIHDIRCISGKSDFDLS